MREKAEPLVKSGVAPPRTEPEFPDEEAKYGAWLVFTPAPKGVQALSPDEKKPSRLLREGESQEAKVSYLTFAGNDCNRFTDN
ncbi:hypothetical protein [Trichloromonas sp.]|uniref:hypothetical protein n=1 Tax=Trichloromonas sp. TaxID=3069249 RepID=UPI002A43F76F|nr:hypothetical protein [Trichloromonas sp.]